MGTKATLMSKGDAEAILTTYEELRLKSPGYGSGSGREPLALLAARLGLDRGKALSALMTAKRVVETGRRVCPTCGKVE